MQTTQEGLLRSLLYSVFCSDPSLIQKVLPEKWNAGSRTLKAVVWSWSDLDETLRRVIEDAGSDKDYCFFVDGLDEYKGQTADSQTEEKQCRDVAKLLHRIASHKNVKICAASRSWPVFEQWFGGPANAHQSLAIQDHTFDDIKHYTGSLLEDDESFRRHRERNSKYNDLIEQLAEKSEGVWLWCKVRVDLYLLLQDHTAYSMHTQYLSRILITYPKRFCFF